jgi:hypothetical protein
MRAVPAMASGSCSSARPQVIVLEKHAKRFLPTEAKQVNGRVVRINVS